MSKISPENEKLPAPSGIDKEGLDQDYAHTCWVKPSIEEAKKRASSHMFANGTASICKTPIEKMTSMGSGIVLYFWLLKQLCILFFFLAITALPAIIVSVSGERISKDYDAVTFALSSTTVGNIFTRVDVTNSTTHSYINLFGHDFYAVDVSFVISMCDVLGCLIFLCVIFYWKSKVQKISKQINIAEVTASDYSIWVEGLPKDATHHEILKFFNDLYGLEEGKIKYADKRSVTKHKATNRGVLVDMKNEELSKGPPKEKPHNPLTNKYWKGKLIKEPTHFFPVQQGPYMGRWVAEVVVAHPNGKAIRAYLRKQSLMRELRRARANVKMLSQSDEFSSAKVKKAMEKLAKVQYKLENNVKNIINKEDDKTCIGAAVMFNNEESRNRCLTEFNPTNLGCNCCYSTPAYLKFRKTYELKISEAPNPSDMIWENYETSSCEVCMRRTFTYLVSLFFLCISVGILAFATSKQEYYVQTSPKLTLCNEDLPALYYKTYNFTKTSDLKLKRGTAEQDKQCNSLFKKSSSSSDDDNWYYIYYDTRSPIIPSNTNDNSKSPCYTPCTSPSTSQSIMCNTLSCYDKSYNKRCEKFNIITQSGCYCSEMLSDNIDKKGYFKGPWETLFGDDDYCYDFAASYLYSLIFSFGTVLLTLIINSLLMNILQYVTKFERRKTKSSEIRSSALKIFVSLFLNTAIIILIVQSNGISGNEVPLKVIGLFGGQYPDFTSAWYTGVGSAILKTMLLNMITAHLWPILNYLIVLPFTRNCCRKAVLQDELDELYEGQDFRIVERLPLIFNTVFVSTLYTSGIPLFYIVASCSFFIQFWVDKAFFLRMYKRPPSYGVELIADCLDILPWSIVLHLILGIWMYGSNDVLFDSSTGEGLLNLHFISDNTGLDYMQIEEAYNEWIQNNKYDYLKLLPKIMRVNVFPLFLLLVIILFVWLMWTIFMKYFVTCCCNTCKICFCSCCYEKYNFEKYPNNHIPTYSGMFIYELDPYYYHELDRLAIQENWHIEDCKTDKGYITQVKMKVWTLKPLIPKKTYEVLAETGLHTYNINANPIYKDAMKAKMQVKHQETFSSIQESRNNRGSVDYTMEIENYDYMQDSHDPSKDCEV